VRGGAIALVNSMLSADSSQFVYNNASEDGGAIHASTTGVVTAVTVALRYTEFTDNHAGTSYSGDCVFLVGVSRWAAVNVSYEPFDALRSVSTQGMGMVSCDESDYETCKPGNACSYGTSTLLCSPCQSNRKRANSPAPVHNMFRPYALPQL
jgi:predicted outer membrane repeat protein